LLSFRLISIQYEEQTWCESMGITSVVSLFWDSFLSINQIIVISSLRKIIAIRDETWEDIKRWILSEMSDNLLFCWLNFIIWQITNKFFLLKHSTHNRGINYTTLWPTFWMNLF
jgi:hypothetical protein